MSAPRLIGVVHLRPLPGSPRYGGDMQALLTAATKDARTLAGAGFEALIVENFGDAPFFPDEAPPPTVAAMTRAVAEIAAAVELPVGVNVLRNDALAAMSIAAATGTSFIRVNVLVGSMFTDQGIITGRAAELARLRKNLGVDVDIVADVFVKHASPPPGLTIEDAAADTVERGMADALIVTGSATGVAPPAELAARVKKVAPATPVLVGSGVTARTVRTMLEASDGVIVGTSLKRGGQTTAPVDPRRAKAFVDASRPRRKRKR